MQTQEWRRQAPHRPASSHCQQAGKRMGRSRRPAARARRWLGSGHHRAGSWMAAQGAVGKGRHPAKEKREEALFPCRGSRAGWTQRPHVTHSSRSVPVSQTRNQNGRACSLLSPCSVYKLLENIKHRKPIGEEMKARFPFQPVRHRSEGRRAPALCPAGHGPRLSCPSRLARDPFSLSSIQCP